MRVRMLKNVRSGQRLLRKGTIYAAEEGHKGEPFPCFYVYTGGALPIVLTHEEVEIFDKGETPVSEISEHYKNLPGFGRF